MSQAAALAKLGAANTIVNVSGNVGIGTNSPSTKLTLADGQITVANGGEINPAINFKSYNSGASGFQIGQQYNTQNLYIRDAAADAQRITLDSSGNVGIGTNSPISKLSVAGASTTAASIDFSGTIAAGTEYTALRFTASGYGFVGSEIRGINTNGGTNLGVMQFLTSGTERMRIDSSGNVGIGTSSFDANWSPKLQVVSSATDGTGGIMIESYRPSLIFKDDSAAAVRQHIVADSSSLIFGSGDSSFTERMRIDPGGNVSLATSGARFYTNSGGISIPAYRSAGTSGSYSSATWYEIASQANLESGVYIVVAWVDTYAAGGAIYYMQAASVPFYFQNVNTNSTSTFILPTLYGTGHADNSVPLPSIRLRLTASGQGVYIDMRPNANWSGLDNTTGKTVYFDFKRMA